MPITIKKKVSTKAVVKPSVTPTTGSVTDASLAVAIDKAGAAQDDYKALNTTVKVARSAFDKLKKAALSQGIADYALDEGNDDGVSIDGGGKYIAELGAKAYTRTVEDNSALFLAFEEVKEGLGLELLSYKLTDIDKYLSKEEKAKLIKRVVSPNRSLTFKKGVKYE